MRAVRALVCSAIVVSGAVLVEPAAAMPSYDVVPADRACAPDSSVSRDGTPTPTAQPAALSALRAPRTVVDVYVHVLRSAQYGGVTGTRIRQQIRVLNRAFAGHQSRYAAEVPFRFKLKDVDATVNRAWWLMSEGSVEERRAKRALHRGNASDLNIYIGRLTTDSLGWGTQPNEHGSAPKLDGIVIGRDTLPGQGGGAYSAGDAAVHETGHWLGLLHTFTGGCRGKGDRVADTPREARPNYKCALRRDTCTAPGRDPVHNFMDYSYDACMNQFTPGQSARMVAQWRRFRDPHRIMVELPA